MNEFKKKGDRFMEAQSKEEKEETIKQKRNV